MESYDTWIDPDGNRHIIWNHNITITQGDMMGDPRMPVLRAMWSEARPAFEEPFIPEQVPGRFANLDWGQP